MVYTGKGSQSPTQRLKLASQKGNKRYTPRESPKISQPVGGSESQCCSENSSTPSLTGGLVAVEATQPRKFRMPQPMAGMDPKTVCEVTVLLSSASSLKLVKSLKRSSGQSGVLDGPHAIPSRECESRTPDLDERAER